MPNSVLRTERDVVLSAPSDRVWDEVAAIDRRPRWLVELHRVDGAPSPAAVGDRFTGESHIFLHHFVGSSCVSQADRGTAFTEEVYLGARMVSSWTFEAESGASDRTRVRHRIDIDFPGGPLGVVLRSLLRWRMRRMQRDSLRNLAKIVQVRST